MNRTTALLAVAVVAGAIGGAARADDAQVTAGSAVKNLTFTGDLRLRNEYFDYRDSNQDPWFKSGTIPADYDRTRFRLREYATYKLPDDFTVVGALASGLGQQISQNMTFGSEDQQAPVWIDRAYGMWTGSFLDGDLNVTAVGGKLATPVWQLTTSEIIYKPDLTPYGFGESANYQVGDMANVFASLFQHFFSSNKTANSKPGPEADMSTLEQVEQVGVEVPLPLAVRIRVAAADHYWRFQNDNPINSDSYAPPSSTPFSSLFAPAKQVGNTRNADGTLLDRYNIGEVTGMVAFQLPNPFGRTPIPLTFMGTALHNYAALGPDFQGWIHGKYYGPNASPFIGYSNDAYEALAKLGNATTAGTWELSYSYRRVGFDSTIADICDADFGGGGLNRKGNTIRAVYKLNNAVGFNLTFYNTWILDQDYYVATVSPLKTISQPNVVNNLQVDMNFNF